MGDFEVPPLEHSPWPTPSRAIYGFALYVTSYVLFGFYLLWAFLPDSWLNMIGLTYIPARHWVITFPYLLVLLFILMIVGYYVRYLCFMPDLQAIAMQDEIVDKGNEEMSSNELSGLDHPVHIGDIIHTPISKKTN